MEDRKKIETIAELKQFLSEEEKRELDRLVQIGYESRERQYRFVNELIERLDRGESITTNNSFENGIAQASMDDGFKIGDYAQQKLYPILKSYPFTKVEIEKLCSNASRTIFGISFPLLFEDEEYKSDREYNHSEKAKRYYRECITTIDGRKFHLCSQWQKNRRVVLKKAIDEFCENPSAKLCF